MSIKQVRATMTVKKKKCTNEISERSSRKEELFLGRIKIALEEIAFELSLEE